MWRNVSAVTTPTTRDRHQATRRLVKFCQPADLVVELTLLLTGILMDRQQRRYHAEELMIIAPATL